MRHLYGNDNAHFCGTVFATDTKETPLPPPKERCYTCDIFLWGEDLQSNDTEM